MFIQLWDMYGVKFRAEKELEDIIEDHFFNSVRVRMLVVNQSLE